MPEPNKVSRSLFENRTNLPGVCSRAEQNSRSLVDSRTTLPEVDSRAEPGPHKVRVLVVSHSQTNELSIK
eukprot:1429387-Heterocapsa_arctica.AAC.1